MLLIWRWKKSWLTKNQNCGSVKKTRGWKLLVFDTNVPWYHLWHALTHGLLGIPEQLKPEAQHNNHFSYTITTVLNWKIVDAEHTAQYIYQNPRESWNSQMHGKDIDKGQYAMYVGKNQIFSICKLLKQIHKNCKPYRHDASSCQYH